MKKRRPRGRRIDETRRRRMRRQIDVDVKQL
jgi:hypothetical protein